MIFARQKLGFLISRSGLSDISDAKTGPRPFFLRVISSVSLLGSTNANFFMFKSISSTSSCTPSIVLYS